MSARKQKPIDRLMAAMDRCALTRGEAQWTMGYRTGRSGLLGLSDDLRLHSRQQTQFAVNESAEKAFRRLALKLLREARQSAPRKTKGAR